MSNKLHLTNEQPARYAIDYRGLGHSAAFGGFREEIGRKVQKLDIEPHTDDYVEITTLVSEFPGALIMMGSCSAQVSFRRTPELLRDGANGVVIVCPTPQHFRLNSGTGDEVLSPGHVGLWDQTRAGEMRNQNKHSATLVHICREHLGRAVRDLERKLGEAKYKPVPMAALLRDYAQIAVEHRERMNAAETSLVAQHLVDMAALVLGESGDLGRQAQMRGLRAAWLERIKADILANYATPGYSIHHVVARLKISERYIQLLFERAGETFSEFLVEQRLQAARRMLTNPEAIDRKIIDVAQGAGFGDLSYFHRRFRRRFGATPAEIRRETGI